MQTIELTISDYAQLRSLEDYLRHTAPDARVTRCAGRPGKGEQGTLDWLQLAANSTVLVTTLKLLPDFLKSRKAETVISAKRGDREIKINRAGDEELQRILDWLLDQ